MLPLQYRGAWMAAGLLLVLAIAGGSLAPGDRLGAVMILDDKVLHAAGYAVLTVWFTGIYPRSRYLAVALGVFALGVVIELLQGAMGYGRERDAGDLVANSTGIAIGLALSLTVLGGWAQRVEARVRDWRSRLR